MKLKAQKTSKITPKMTEWLCAHVITHKHYKEEWVIETFGIEAYQEMRSLYFSYIENIDNVMYSEIAKL
jgi:hypothetical protein